jgi:hypothetical protein
MAAAAAAVWPFSDITLPAAFASENGQPSAPPPAMMGP